MDKIKTQAEHVAVKGQESSARVKAKFEEMQERRDTEALMVDLGTAYYAEQREHGPHDAVEKAMAALDAHSARSGAADS